MKTLFPKLMPLALLCALHAGAHAGVVADHPGYWMGDLKLPDGRVLKSGVELFKRADGSAWASFSVPDQGAYNIAVKSMEEKGDTVALQLGFGQMKMTWVGAHFKAEWTQGGATFPLELEQVAAFPRKPRPQTPAAPFPYTEETIAIRSTDGVTLGATLSMPKGVRKDGAKPNVAILVHGSGPQTRDEELAGHQVFAVLSDYLLRQGIAVLRYDKRGVARSTGDYEGHTQVQLADDLDAVLKAVRARRQFGRVGLVGHSEGPMVAAKVAARHPKAGGQPVDFLVSLAGVGLPGLDLIVLQDRLQATDNGASPQEVEQLTAYVRHFYAIVIAEADSAARALALKAYQSSLPDADKAMIAKYRMDRGTLSLEMAAEPALRVLLMADPRTDWRRVACPVLALNGSLDHQVPPESLTGIVAALREGGNSKVESKLIPSLNHLFQTAKTGSASEYAQIEETIAPVALQQVAAFIRKQK